ncbi:MAG: tocopherol cyclase family protein [Thermoplasmatota archaeon]
MVVSRLRRLWHPERFQGSTSSRHYFEGWYYKLVDAAEHHRLAVIPGISMGENREESHAFVQVFNGTMGDFTYFTYDVDAFSASRDAFMVSIADNVFSAREMRLDIDRQDRHITGVLHFDNTVPLPSRLFSPGIMGWYTFVPFMECKHGVVSMNHCIAGSLNVDGEEMSFDDGRGYIEKDYGHSFPRAYIWMQSNHFDGDVSFMLSVARIPWLWTEFTGFLGALWYDGHVHRFTTYTGARIRRFAKQEDGISLSIVDKQHRLNVEARSDRAISLKSPQQGNMTGRIQESLTGTLHLALYERDSDGDHLVFEGTGRQAGIEIMDDDDVLVADLTQSG